MFRLLANGQAAWTGRCLIDGDYILFRLRANGQAEFIGYLFKVSRLRRGPAKAR